MSPHLPLPTHPSTSPTSVHHPVHLSVHIHPLACSSTCHPPLSHLSSLLLSIPPSTRRPYAHPGGRPAPSHPSSIHLLISQPSSSARPSTTHPSTHSPTPPSIHQPLTHPSTHLGIPLQSFSLSTHPSAHPGPHPPSGSPRRTGAHGNRASQVSRKSPSRGAPRTRLHHQPCLCGAGCRGTPFSSSGSNPSSEEQRPGCRALNLQVLWGGGGCKRPRGACWAERQGWGSPAWPTPPGVLHGGSGSGGNHHSSHLRHGGSCWTWMWGPDSLRPGAGTGV